MKQSNYSRVILHVKCKKLLILTAFTWFLILDKIQDGDPLGKIKGFPLKSKLFENS